MHARSSKRLGRPVDMVTGVNGRIHAKACTGKARPHRSLCTQCAHLWLREGTGRTQGSSQGAVYLALKNWRATLRSGRRSISQVRAKLRDTRRADKNKMIAQQRADSKRCMTMFSPHLVQYIEKIAHLVHKHGLPPEFLKEQEMHFNNAWREGNQVHGRRYPEGTSDTTLALSAVARQKQAKQLCGMLAANMVTALPSRRTLMRRTESLIFPTFGVQPSSTFQHLPTLVPKRPLHICNDEVAVNQMIDNVRLPDGDEEIAGLANRCVREKNPDGMQYILQPKEGTVRIIQSRVVDGCVRVTETIEPLSCLEDLAQQKPASLLCLWIVFDPTHEGKQLYVAAVPTCGDLTVSDDAAMLHGIVTAAQTAGRQICFYGADNASPHAALSRGIVRGLSLNEVTLLRRTAELVVTAATHVLDGARRADLVCAPTIDWEETVVGLVPILHRPISVIMRLLKEVHGAPPFVRSTSDMLAHVIANQWSLPYPGLPYALLRCDITSRLLGLSCEWRHTGRLLVRYSDTQKGHYCTYCIML